MEILRALYRVGVSRADEKLGGVLDALRGAGAHRNLISTIISEYVDPDRKGTPEFLRQIIDETRSHCGPEDRVAGDMRAVLRFPHKLLWYADHPSRLFDLRVDPHERIDIAATSPRVVAELERALPPRYRPRETLARPHVGPNPRFLDELRALGYLGESEAPVDAPPPDRDPGTRGVHQPDVTQVP
jgi:hypothetical protein